MKEEKVILIINNSLYKNEEREFPLKQAEGILAAEAASNRKSKDYSLPKKSDYVFKNGNLTRKSSQAASKAAQE